MNFEQINTETENAISAMRAEVARGVLKRVFECWAFVTGYTQTRPLMMRPIWEAIHELVKTGKIKY